MTDAKEQLSYVQEQDTGTTNETVVVIKSEVELVNFLVDILCFGDCVDEADLEKDNSFKILYSLLKRSSVVTIAIEDKS